MQVLQNEISQNDEKFRALNRELAGTERDKQLVLKTRKKLYELLQRCQVAAADAASKAATQKDAVSRLQVAPPPSKPVETMFL